MDPRTPTPRSPDVRKRRTSLFQQFLRWVFALLAATLLIVNFVQNGYKLELYSICVLAFLFVLAYVPDITVFLGRIKRVKSGEFELELSDQIAELSAKTEVLESSHRVLQQKAIPEEILARINRSMNDPRGALIGIGVEIEKRLFDLLDSNSLSRNPGYFSARMAMEKLVDAHVLPSEAFRLFQDFWSIRNKASHAYHFDLDPDQLYRIAEIGVKILTYLY